MDFKSQFFYVYLSFQKIKPVIFNFTRVMFNFLTKNDILRICIEKNTVEKLKNWTHCLRMQQKKHMQKRTGTAKGGVSISKPIKISSNEILATICARLLDRLAQMQEGYGEHK